MPPFGGEVSGFEDFTLNSSAMGMISLNQKLIMKSQSCANLWDSHVHSYPLAKPMVSR